MTASPLQPKVLVVDDHHDGAEALGSFLSLLGCEVKLVHSGLAAVDEAPRFQPQLVILDIQMEGIDGIETARRLRAQPWARRSMFATHSASSDPAIADLSRDAGCEHHIPKPATGEVFERIVALVRERMLEPQE
jgi:CheY-like chemotaxis protein